MAYDPQSIEPRWQRFWEEQRTFVAVDGGQIYPRRGRTIVASAPAWSKDGHSLAFLEAPADRAARLVLVAEVDNPTGDTTWDLPPTTPLSSRIVIFLPITSPSRIMNAAADMEAIPPPTR